MKELSPSLKAISIEQFKEIRAEEQPEGRGNIPEKTRDSRGTHELWQHCVRPSVPMGCCTSSERVGCAPGPTAALAGWPALLPS